MTQLARIEFNELEDGQVKVSVYILGELDPPEEVHEDIIIALLETAGRLRNSVQVAIKRFVASFSESPKLTQ